MPTISFSTTYVSQVSSSVTSTTANITTSVSTSTNLELKVAELNRIQGSMLSFFVQTGSFSPFISQPATITFRNSTDQTLVSYSANELTRTLDANGYVVMSNFPPKIPSLAGTISSMVITADALKVTTFSVGAPGGGADIQFDDRDLVTSQPWRLDGNIKFRVPVSYEYTV
jgi:hypothetical protein